MANLNFGTKNETLAYLIGKDIANLEAKIENIGTTSGSLNVLKVIVPAATEEQVNNNTLATVNLPDEFKNSLVAVQNNYGTYEFMVTKDMDTINFMTDTVEKEIFITKLADFKNPKETAHAEIKKTSGGAAASDA